MKKVALVFCILFWLNQVDAQSNKFNHFAIEASGGLAMPLSPMNDTKGSDYTGLNSFQIAGRYNFYSRFNKNLQYLGVRLSYSHHGFRDSKNSNLGISYNKITAEAVYNIGQQLGLGYRFYENYGLLAHAGAGVSFATPVGESFYEKIGNLQLGLTPQVKISDKVAFFADVTYVLNLKQHYYYDGSLIYNNFDHKTGGFTTISFGIMFYPGEKIFHADWY